MKPPPLDLRGVKIFSGWLSLAEQTALLDDLRRVVRAVPLVAMKTPRGGKMSVRMTAAGALGWVSDKTGYRYAEKHFNGSQWPEIPVSVLKIWNELAGTKQQPDCCLINFYGESAKMGLHRDQDEADYTYPVVSISLGDDGLFRVGNLARGGKTESLWLRSGDVAVLGGAARLIYHGVDRIRFNSSTLLPNGGRINLTMRVAR